MITHSRLSRFVPNIVLIFLTLCCILPLLLLALASFTDEQMLILHGYSFFPRNSVWLRTSIFLRLPTPFSGLMDHFFRHRIGTFVNVMMTIFWRTRCRGRM